jgi:antitoxin PrlF
MIYGKMTAKAQTTVPLAVRRALGLAPGDDIVWTVEPDGRVTVRGGPHFPDSLAASLRLILSPATPPA